jgi:hypothetical protein
MELSLLRVSCLVLLVIVLVPGASAEGMDLVVKDISAPAGSELSVPLVVQNAEQLYLVDIEVSYDPAVLEFSHIELGDIAQNGIVEATEVRAGLLRIDLVDTTGISRDGNLVTISFNVIGNEGTGSSIGITSKAIKNLDNNDVPANLVGGEISVTSAGLSVPLHVFVPVLAAGLALLLFCHLRRDR